MLKSSKRIEVIGCEEGDGALCVFRVSLDRGGVLDQIASRCQVQPRMPPPTPLFSYSANAPSLSH